ncbi:MAG: relaxase/mobilization nuclease domain-containing protein, partial [Hyphomicrobiaceae bacterium]
MLARIEPPHGDFPALASYLRHGRTRPTSPDRVAWVIGHNIPTADPMLAAAIMTATARQSARCTTPAYHLSINWREDERPAPEAMQEIARRTLELAGLGEHQALVMGHGDKPHRHLHMMINRVHPGTGKAWSAFQDFRRFDRIMKALAEAHGFLFVPCHRYEPEITDARPKLPGREARRAAEKGADTLRIQGSRADARRIGAEISENLDRAASWDDIEAALEPYGLQLEAKGRGLVAGNRAGYFKFSQLGLAVTANGLAKRFGRRFRPRPAPVRRPARS